MDESRDARVAPPLPPAPNLRCDGCELDAAKPEQCRLCGGTRSLKPRRGSPLEFGTGMLLFVRASAELFAEPRYRGKLLWAMFWNAIAWSLAFAIAFFVVFRGLEEWLAELPDWIASWTAWAGGILAVLLTAGVGLYVFPTVFALLLFPFLDPLERAAEGVRLGWMPAESARGFFGDAWDGLHTALRTLLLQFLALLLTLPLALTGIGLPITIFVSAFFAGFAWLDYPLARRGFGFGQKWRRCREHLWLTAGLGMGFQLALLVPIFGLFLAIPAATVASAHAYLRMRN